jgi:hypothetical protein
LDISLIPAAIFAIEGNYKFLDIPVKIVNSNVNIITRFAIATLGIYANLFIHEVGHALVTRKYYGKPGRIVLCDNMDAWSEHPAGLYTTEIDPRNVFLISFAGAFADLVNANVKSLLTMLLIRLMKNKREQKAINCYEKAIVRLLNVQTLFNLCVFNCVLIKLLCKISMGYSIAPHINDFTRIYVEVGLPALMKSATIVWIFTASAIFLIYKQSYTSKEKIQPLYVRIYLYVHIKLSQTSVLMRSSLSL